MLCFPHCSAGFRAGLRDEGRAGLWGSIVPTVKVWAGISGGQVARQILVCVCVCVNAHVCSYSPIATGQWARWEKHQRASERTDGREGGGLVTARQN